MIWAIENPNAGIVETDEMDYRRCLEIQTPYLGPVRGVYTDWTPLAVDARTVRRPTSTGATRGSSRTFWYADAERRSMAGSLARRRMFAGHGGMTRIAMAP